MEKVFYDKKNVYCELNVTNLSIFLFQVKYKKDAIALRTTFTNNYRNFEQETTRILNEEKYLIWNCDDYRLNSII